MRTAPGHYEWGTPARCWWRAAATTRFNNEKGATTCSSGRARASASTGFIATPDGVPAFLVMPDFVPHESYGWPEFDELPADVVVADASPQGLLDKLRSAGVARDAFLLGGRRTHGTIRHVYALT